MNLTLQKSEPLAPYDPDRQGWTRRQATHLLWRTQYGATYAEISAAETAGLEATLERLLTPQPESPEFETSQRLLRQIAVDTTGVQNLKAWWLYRMLNSANPLVEKMTLLWHNHFATSYSKVQSVRHMAAQNNLLRREALGNFRELLLGMTSDVAMLIWLDGNMNRKRHANENFAREVMELFSLGEGNYTEQDIVEAARAFTGWHVRNGEFWFNKLQHDYDSKTVLGQTGNFNGEDVIDICLAQEACPRFLALKLLRGFVTERPSEEQILQLAARIAAHDYQMRPVLRELFGSQMFFAADVPGSLIKSPLELVLGACRTVSEQPNLQELARITGDLGQDIFEPPTVKGWEGGRLWINSATMLQRANFAGELTSGNRLAALNEDPALAGPVQGPADLVKNYTELLLARDLALAAYTQLNEYVQQTRDRNQQLRGLLNLIMTMPEFQLF